MIKRIRGWFQCRVAALWLDTMNLAQYLADEDSFDVQISREDCREINHSIRRGYTMLGLVCLYIYGASRVEWRRALSSGSDYEILIWCKKILAARFSDPLALRIFMEYAEWEEEQTERAEAYIKAQNPPSFPSIHLQRREQEHREVYAILADIVGENHADKAGEKEIRRTVAADRSAV